MLAARIGEFSWGIVPSAEYWEVFEGPIVLRHNNQILWLSVYPERFIFHQIGKQVYTQWLPAYDINPRVPKKYAEKLQMTDRNFELASTEARFAAPTAGLLYGTLFSTLVYF